MAAYALPPDLLTFYDRNTIGDLVTDDGAQVPVETLVDAASPEYQRLLSLLASASGRIDSACLVAGIYSAAGLAALTGNALSLLKELTCRLAMVLLVQRRPEKVGADYWKVAKEETENFLDRLRKGERLFGLADNIDAGLPTVDGPTATTMRRLNTLRVRANRFYPDIADELPIGRQY